MAEPYVTYVEISKDYIILVFCGN